MIQGKLIVDNFAGGGGASTAIERALGCPVDIAINHDGAALAMHEANHPHAIHLCEDVWEVDIKEVVAGRPVALAWFSPDCKHFSKAKGGKPVEKKIRGLAWVVLKWASAARPEVIILENVEEFQDWGPLIGDKPDKTRKGETFRRWKSQLEDLGYVVECRELRACDYGAPTSRKRLFVVARCDGKKIVWPEPTHGPQGNLFLKPYLTAADCIDWSIPCPSIFERKRPLAENTLRRIAKGVQRYVIDNPNPFIVPIAHFNGTDRVHSIDEPMRTITAYPKGGSMAVCVPSIVKVNHGGDDFRGQDIDSPLQTMTSKHGYAMVAAFLAQHNNHGSGQPNVGHMPTKPISTLTSSGSHQSVVTSHLVKLRGTCADGQKVDQPMPTVTAGGLHIGEVRAFLLKYYGTDQNPRLDRPMPTATTKERMALVTVHGEEYVIADIGMRMLTAPEMFKAQGFPEGYIIDPFYKGRRLTKTEQHRMCGNSVSPPPGEALVQANVAIHYAREVA